MPIFGCRALTESRKTGPTVGAPSEEFASSSAVWRRASVPFALPATCLHQLGGFQFRDFQAGHGVSQFFACLQKFLRIAIISGGFDDGFGAFFRIGRFENT